MSGVLLLLAISQQNGFRHFSPRNDPSIIAFFLLNNRKLFKSNGLNKTCKFASHKIDKNKIA